MHKRWNLTASALSAASDSFRSSTRGQARLASTLQSTYKLYPTKKDSNGALLSRVSGPTDKPLCQLSLGQFWEEAVAKYADRPALISKHEPAHQHGRTGSDSDDCIRWSYGAMNEHVQSLVAGLLELGVRKGDRVAVLMMNCSAYGALQWACAEVGAVLVTLNPAYSTSELRRAINLVEATTLFIVPSLRGTNYLDSILELLPSLTSSTSSSGDRTMLQDESLPSLKRVVLVDNLDNRPRHWESNSVLAQQGKSFADAMSALHNRAIDYRDLLVSAKSATSKPEVLNTDVINLQLTSGTTGMPKAVALTSKNLLNNGIAIGDNLRFTEADRLCNIPPLFHCFGLVLGNLAAWTHGASIVYAAEGFDPLRSLRAVSEERCTAMHGVPTHFIAELDLLDSARDHQRDPERYPLPTGMLPGETFDFSSLRTGLTSGSTVPIALMQALVDPDLMHLGSQTVVYGMTETSPVTFGCDVDAPIVRRCETVGRVYPHVHAKIVSPDDPTGQPLPVGQPGELCTAGYVVMEGYWKDPKRTDEAMERHPDEPDIVWMRTGDIGIMDEEGYVRIVGRSKDVIIRGGENLFPPNIENCIDRIEGIATNAVIAVPDDKYGEAVGVFVARSHAEAHVTPADIRAYVKKHVGGQSAPAWIWFLGEQGVPAEFPKTASGKIQKVILRDWAKDLAAKGQGKVDKA
ncbi:AMP-binding enzyme C-terminal domain protein [Kalmanozyma brasiliensis GHG001]|uniref:Long chain fatty acid acyl-CoA ligase n=1 Tax=Kalmanozyma brasiliensis (strain GHG001) TaxID=1365824 RepID=V5ETR4_KALBG|nr:AMP-binding enzyme C-terminal domain protein [Kalmanozyma brasiliensis GHG001]EST08670.1 AMP-binding enzyme C-terminal domain protein [Kalmanozyma brasiliensis GHG001]